MAYPLCEVSFGKGSKGCRQRSRPTACHASPKAASGRSFSCNPPFLYARGALCPRPLLFRSQQSAQAPGRTMISNVCALRDWTNECGNRRQFLAFQKCRFCVVFLHFISPYPTLASAHDAVENAVSNVSVP